MRPLAVALVSGGLDSCVSTAIAAQSHDLAALHLDYRQKTEARERRAFFDICRHFEIPEERQMIAQSDFLYNLGRSALIDPDVKISDGGRLTRGVVPDTYVPFRNAHLLSMAVSWAEVLQADAIYLGIMEEDGAGYPDCTEAFCSAFQKAVRAGSTTGVRICAPLLHHSKSCILKLGAGLDAPVHLTWSCYGREDVACGTCDSCVLRLRAFDEAGLEDPISYEIG